MSEENVPGDESQKDGSEIDEFQFYFSFTKPLVLELPSSEDRAIAAAWVQKLEGEPDSGDEKQQRLNYLKLLLFVLQRGRLSGIFKKQPPAGPLLPFPQGFSLLDMGNWMLDQDDGQTSGAGDARRLPYTVELSNDLREFVASQEIPNFGIQMYYAWSSDEPIHKWGSFDEEKFPQYILDKIKQLKETKSDEKPFIVKNGCLTKKKGCDLTPQEKYSKKKVKSPQEIERSQGRSFHTYVGLVGRMGNFNDKCDDDPEKFQRQDMRKVKCQGKNAQKRCPGSGGEADDVAPEEEFDNFVTGLGGLNAQNKSCPCPTPCHHQNRNDLQAKGGPQSYEDPQADCRNINVRADVENPHYPVSGNKSMSPRRQMREQPACPELEMPEMMPQQRLGPSARSRSGSPTRANQECPPNNEVERLCPPEPARAQMCPPSPARAQMCPPSPARAPVCPPDPPRTQMCPPSPARAPVCPPDPARTQMCPPSSPRAPVCPPDPARTQMCPPSSPRAPVCPPDQARSQVCPPSSPRTPVCPPDQARAPICPPSSSRAPDPARTSACPPTQKSPKHEACPSEGYKGRGGVPYITFNSMEAFAASDTISPYVPRGGGMRSGVPEIVHCYDARNPDPSLAQKIEKQWTQTARDFNRNLDTDLKNYLSRDQLAGGSRQSPCNTNARGGFAPQAESTRIDCRSCQPPEMGRTSDRQRPPSRHASSAPLEPNPCNYPPPEDVQPPCSPRANQQAAYGQQQTQQNYVECEGEAPPPMRTPDPCGAQKPEPYAKCPPSQMNKSKNTSNYQCSPFAMNDSGRMANMNNALQGMKQRTETSKEKCESAGARRSFPNDAACYPGNVQAKPQTPKARQQIAFEDGGMPGVCGGELNSSRNARPAQQVQYSQQAKPTQPCGSANQRGYVNLPNSMQNKLCTSQQQQQQQTGQQQMVPQQMVPQQMVPQRQQMPSPIFGPECYPNRQPTFEEAEPCPEEEGYDCESHDSMEVIPSVSNNMSRSMAQPCPPQSYRGKSPAQDCPKPGPQKGYEPQKEQEFSTQWGSMQSCETNGMTRDYQSPLTDMEARPMNRSQRSPGRMAQQEPRMNASQRECMAQQESRVNTAPREMSGKYTGSPRFNSGGSRSQDLANICWVSPKAINLDQINAGQQNMIPDPRCQGPPVPCPTRSNYSPNRMPPQAMDANQQFLDYCEPQMVQGAQNAPGDDMDQCEQQNYMFDAPPDELCDNNVQNTYVVFTEEDNQNYNEPAYMNSPSDDPTECYDEYQEVNEQNWVSMPIRSDGRNICPETQRNSPDRQRNCSPNAKNNVVSNCRDPYSAQTRGYE